MIITALSSSAILPQVLSASYQCTMSETSMSDVDYESATSPQVGAGLIGAAVGTISKSSTIRHQPARDTRLQPEASNTYAGMNTAHKARDSVGVNCQTTNAAKFIEPGETIEGCRGEKRPRMETELDAETPTTKSRKISTPVRSLPAACKNPASVAKRNARERRRIKNVNLAFDELRQHVPSGEQNKKKISKVDTLQSAIEYIKALENLIKRKRMLENETEDNRNDIDDCDGSESIISSSTDDISCCPDGDESGGKIQGDSGSTMRNDRDVSSSLSSARSMSSFQDDDVILVSSTVPVQGDVQSFAPNGTEEISPMLEEFDSVVERCAERNRRASEKQNPVGQMTDGRGDVEQYIPQQYFDDSGYSDDSASTHCDQIQQISHVYRPLTENVMPESVAAFPRVGATPPAPAPAVLDADDIQTLLDGGRSSSEVGNHLVGQYHPLPAFDFTAPSPFFIPHPSSDYRSGNYQQSCPPSFTSTPRVEKSGNNDTTTFVFPPVPPHNNHWLYGAPDYSANAEGPIVDGGAVPPIDTSFEGYRFGDTNG